MKKNEIKNPFELIDDLEYLLKTTAFNMFGKSWVDHKKFAELLELVRSSTELLVEKSKKIEMREQRIYEEAEKKCEQMLQETQDKIGNMNPVKEAETYAIQIVERAQEDAEKIKREAMETSENTISHGEKVKNELINQGYLFVEELIVKSLQSYEDNQQKLSSLLQGPREELLNAYEEIRHMTKKDKDDNEIAS